MNRETGGNLDLRDRVKNILVNPPPEWAVIGRESSSVSELYRSYIVPLAGIFILKPALGFLQTLGLYSLYLLYLRLPVLMKVPQVKALVYPNSGS